jgi:tRNA pseudouridine38-40 synthase
VKSATWTDLGDGLLQFEIVGKSFCHNQVRAIVGTLIETGIGKRTAGQMLGVLRSKDRSLAGTVAPAHGLCLWEVGYDN